MKSRHIGLPQPASRIWKHATRLVDELLKQCKTLDDHHWYLGGGTALAADWHHRTSTDVDILIAPGLSMAALYGKGYERLGELISETNGTRIDAPDQKLSVEYANDGKVDIFSSGRQLPGHEQPIEIAGQATLRLSNAQIFAGKFRRAIEKNVAARDLFDICHSARINDAGMQQALNAFKEPELEEVWEFWENSSAKIEEEAHKRLSGIPREYWVNPHELVERTLKATEDHRYSQVVIQAGNNEVRIRTVTRGGRRNEYRSNSTEIERDFNALGIARHLQCHNINARAVINDAQRAMGQSIEETVAETAREQKASDRGNKPRISIGGGDIPIPESAPAPASGSAAAADEKSRQKRGVGRKLLTLM